jgi:hypothetical protein
MTSLPLIRPAGRRHGWRPAKKDSATKKRICGLAVWPISTNAIYGNWRWPPRMPPLHNSLWSRPGSGPVNGESTGGFVQNLKITRSGGRKWRRRVRHFPPCGGATRYFSFNGRSQIGMQNRKNGCILEFTFYAHEEFVVWKFGKSIFPLTLNKS